jgi:L,D-transpeptidase catalytic domain
MRHRGMVLACTLAMAAFAAPAYANVVITVDKSTQQMSVVVDGAPRWVWRVSTGGRGYDTPSGTFRAFRMEANHFSKEFDDAPMPHSIFFTKVGHAVHGYLDTRHLGLPVSHGCVRLDPQNATALYALVQQEGVLNTTVVVTGHIPTGDPAAVARRAPQSRPGELGAEPASAPYGQPYASQYSRPAPYGYQSSDDRYAPPVYRRSYSDQPGYPPAPPPGYPAYPRAGFPF